MLIRENFKGEQIMAYGDIKWKVTFIVHRQKKGKEPYFQTFELEVDPEEYVLDGVERIWAYHDRSLTFQHACHHSTCGACGMRVNGKEKLTCITKIKDVTQDGGTLKIEPLRNFPVVSDLVPDLGKLYVRMELVEAKQIVSLAEAPLTKEVKRIEDPKAKEEFRLGDCIECGLCISACPVVGTAEEYLGPAVLAAAQQQFPEKFQKLLPLVDCANGVWRCHSAYECTEVCPSNVEPGWRIMDLRKQVIAHNIRKLFGLE